MTDHCFEIEEAAAILELPDDHPRRTHVKECTRCQSVLLSYSAFLEGETSEGARPVQAEARLSAFIRETVHGGTTSPSSSPTSAGGHDSFFTSLLRGLFARPAMAAAALVIVAAGVLLWQPWVSEVPVLRNAPQGDTSAPLALRPVEHLAGGTMRLSWSPMSDADRYQVRFYADDLSELGRLDPVTETFVVLGASEIPGPDGAETAAVHWRVFALRNGDDVGVSAPATLGLE